MTLNKTLFRSLAGSLLLMVVLILAGCPQRRDIAYINRDPARYMNKEVAVVGRVTESFGIMGQGMFRVDDGTGSIWVLSNGYGVPARGMKVGVTGTIQPTLSLGGRSFATVMRETHRRSDKGGNVNY